MFMSSILYLCEFLTIYFFYNDQSGKQPGGEI